MLLISQEQIAKLELTREEAYRRGLAMLLQESYPELISDADAVDAVVEVGMADAREAGLTSARGIAVYVVIAFLLGLAVKEEPQFVAMMTHSGRSEAEKIAWMEAWILQIADAFEAR